MAIIESVNLDLKRPSQFVIIRVQQNDYLGNKIKVNITLDGEEYPIPTGTRAQLSMMAGNIVPVLHDCEIIDNQVIFTITNDMTSYSGRFQAQIRLMNASSGSLIKTLKFHLLVEEETGISDVIVQTSEFNTLDNALVRVEDLVENVGNSIRIVENINNQEVQREENESSRSSNEDTRIQNENERIIKESLRWNFRTLTQAEYDALPLSEKIDPNMIYEIIGSSEDFPQELASLISRTENAALAAEELVVNKAGINDLIATRSEAFSGYKVDAKFSVIDNEMLDVKSQLRQITYFVTPEMCGAKGDGIEDDTEALQTALNISITQKIQLILPGHYLISTPLRIYNKTAVSGYATGIGKRNGKISANGCSAFELIVDAGNINTSNITMMYLEIDCTGYPLFSNDPINVLKIEYSTFRDLDVRATSMFKNVHLLGTTIEHINFRGACFLETYYLSDSAISWIFCDGKGSGVTGNTETYMIKLLGAHLSSLSNIFLTGSTDRDNLADGPAIGILIVGSNDLKLSNIVTDYFCGQGLYIKDSCYNIFVDGLVIRGCTKYSGYTNYQAGLTVLGEHNILRNVNFRETLAGYPSPTARPFWFLNAGTCEVYNMTVGSGWTWSIGQTTSPAIWSSSKMGIHRHVPNTSYIEYTLNISVAASETKVIKMSNTSLPGTILFINDVNKVIPSGVSVTKIDNSNGIDVTFVNSTTDPVIITGKVIVWYINPLMR